MRYLLFLFAISLAAQPTISSITIAEKTSGCLLIQGQLSAGSFNASLEYGTTTALGSETRARFFSGTTTSMWPSACGMEPGGVVYFRPKAGASSSWTCVGDATHTCDSGVGVVTMLAAESHVPVAPSNLPDTAALAVNGNTYNVTATDGCTDGTTGLLARMTQAAAADDSLVHEIVIPAGTVCSDVVVPAKAGTGWIIVRTDGTLPPEGVRITSEYLPQTAIIEIPLSRYNTGDYNTALTTRSIAATQGWRFTGIQFRIVSSLTPSYWNVTDVNEATGVITVDTAGVGDAPTTHQHVAVYGTQGLTGQTPNVMGKAFFASSSSFKITPYHMGGTINSYSGTYTSGGKVVRATGFAVSGATNASPIVVTTANEHGLTNRQSFTVSSVTTGVVTTSATHDIAGSTSPYHDAAVVIEGSSVSEHNGIWDIVSNTGTTVTLTSFPGSACSSSCGTVRVVQMVAIQGVVGNTAANGSWFFDVVSNTQVSLYDSTGNGAYTSGGALAYEPDYVNYIVNLEGSSRMIFDRCWIDSGGFPRRAGIALAMKCSDCAIVDSYVRADNWRQTNPITDTVVLGIDGQNVATSAAIDITNGGRKRIHNNLLQAVGVAVFAQETAAVDGRPEDVEFTQNYIYADPALRAGSTENTAQLPGLWYPRRHSFELKDGVRFLVSGNIFANGWQDITGLGNQIAIASPRGGKNISDIDWRNNVFIGGATTIYGNGTDDIPTDGLNLITKRIRIENNIALDFDHRKYRSNPTGGGATNGGQFVIWADGGQGITVRNNTVVSLRGPIPAFFFFSSGRLSSVTVENNIIGDSTEGGYRAFIAGSGYIGMGTPQPSGTVAASFLLAAPNSTVRNNVIVPLVDGTTSDSNYTSTGSETYTQTECNTNYSSFTSFTCLDGSTALARLAAMKWLSAAPFTDVDWSKFRLKYDSPGISGARLTIDGTDAGADIGKIEVAAGVVKGARVLSIGTTTATIAFTAPDSVGCTVDRYTADPLTFTRVANAGGARVQTVSLTGLSSGTVYTARINCAAEQPTVAFRTN